MGKMHLRDQQFRRLAIHFDIRIHYYQLTDKPELVTCQRCLIMIKRQKEKEW